MTSHQLLRLHWARQYPPSGRHLISAGSFRVFFVSTPTESSSCLPRLAVGEAVTLIFTVKSSNFERKCHPDRSEVCPSDLTALNKSHHPPLVIPTRISCHVALDRAACAPFRKDRRMKCINVTNLNRKSGGAQPRDLRCAPAPAQRSPFR
jgi:hypothetical protein